MYNNTSLLSKQAKAKYLMQRAEVYKPFFLFLAIAFKTVSPWSMNKDDSWEIKKSSNIFN